MRPRTPGLVAAEVAKGIAMKAARGSRDCGAFHAYYEVPHFPTGVPIGRAISGGQDPHFT